MEEVPNAYTKVKTEALCHPTKRYEEHSETQVKPSHCIIQVMQVAPKVGREPNFAGSYPPP
ncbi:hypothetical protein COLO4_06800 [Corchorus olitorius]|uniref:Uncharacterized protein n=1 Tax=Corchorus olitorius TaxID=93759 RepID=A0A1R3KLW2_9ROSI|nr:hypothetical protein COLO4_06800 [Corchorus olitorius]